MSHPIQVIPFTRLALAFLPVLVVTAILYGWSLGGGNALYAVLRMLVQLLLVGYFLNYVFGSENGLTVLAVLAVMLAVSAWIALRTVQARRRGLYGKALGAIVLAGGLILVLITQGVLGLNPWFSPDFMIPLAGMIFANAMNSVSLAAERLDAEIRREVPYPQARGVALRASLIPITNSLFAVGLVSLPGMMTGQILSGVSPLIAVRYQIMVMCMIFGSAGIASAAFLSAVRTEFAEEGP